MFAQEDQDVDGLPRAKTGRALGVLVMQEPEPGPLRHMEEGTRLVARSVVQQSGVYTSCVRACTSPYIPSPTAACSAACRAMRVPSPLACRHSIAGNEHVVAIELGSKQGPRDHCLHSLLVQPNPTERKSQPLLCALNQHV